MREFTKSKSAECPYVPDNNNVPTAAGDGQSILVKSRNSTAAQHVPDAVHTQRNQVHDHVRRQSFVTYHLVVRGNVVQTLSGASDVVCRHFRQ